PPETAGRLGQDGVVSEPDEAAASRGDRPPRRRFPFFARILAAMLLGILVGLTLGERADALGKIGTVIIGLIKTLAAPLLFFAVVDAFLRTHIRARSGMLMVGITAVNALLAVVIGLALSNLLEPGKHLSVSSTLESKSLALLAEARKIDFWSEIAGYVPS